MREFTTERLRLRAWREDDVDTVLDMYSRPEVMRYINPAAVLDPHDRDAALASIHRRQGVDDGVHGMWAVEALDGGGFVGQILSKHIPWSEGYGEGRDAVTEIGWHLHPAAWGRGYATEAARAVLDHLLASGLPRVIAVTHPENLASQAVCRRLGMAYVGRTSEFYDAEVELFEVHG